MVEKYQKVLHIRHQCRYDNLLLLEVQRKRYRISKSEIKIGIEAPGDVTINREEVPKEDFMTQAGNKD